MGNPENRIKVFAVNNYKVWSKFDIYLEFQGRREWLMMHRHDGVLYDLMRNGISLRELRQQTGFRKEKVKYILKVIDEYLEEQESA